ncbi:hypothetical protein PC116_g9474 [Phytophthora cactorum]|nr:hypothetical protein PC120_g17482 [Phytophthora cactorum]KAG3183085.1 hypothetical protein PC128_g14354 [Phytophthora cactorum]KAG4054331.1 hypothetical protein PC123_g10554 [Phytophthora cactorum]KAG4242647.1 hypothetical protein PC116_g9474 [Phytophthora cactorum]
MLLSGMWNESMILGENPLSRVLHTLRMQALAAVMRVTGTTSKELEHKMMVVFAVE